MESGQQHQQYNYGPPTTQPPPRASPNGQHAMMQQPSLLPPIHHGGLPSQPQYAAHPGQYVPPSQYSQYQNGAMQPAPMPSTVAPTAQNGMMRFSLPPAPVDARGMTASRHKKEIKRRTKTGCLTCRKRRIKVCREHCVRDRWTVAGARSQEARRISSGRDRQANSLSNEARVKRAHH